MLPACLKQKQNKNVPLGFFASVKCPKGHMCRTERYKGKRAVATAVKIHPIQLMSSARIWQVCVQISYPKGLEPLSLSWKWTKFNFRQLKETEPQTFVLAVFLFNIMHIFMHSMHLHEMHKYRCKDLFSPAFYLYQEIFLGHCVKKQQGQNYLFLQHTKADSSNSPCKHFPRQGHAV